MVGVGAVYAVGRSLWDRRTGLVAAAVLCFAFLPVAFSRLAVTDVGTLAPVAVVLLLSVRMHEGAGWRTCLWAGAAAGLAIGFKYTAGLVLLAPGLALALPLLARRDGAALRGAATGLLALLAGTFAAFFVTNPYFFLDLDTALHQLRGQAELAGNQDKFGQEQRRRPALLPRQPAVGPRLRRRARGGGRGGRHGAARPRAPRDPADLPRRAVPLPERAVALLRALAAAGLPGAGAARRARVRRRARRAAGPRAAPAVAGAGRGARAAAVAAARRRRALDGRARPRGHARDRAPVARRAQPARAAGDRRARGAGALVLAGPRRAPPAAAARAVRQRVHPRHPRGARRVRPHPAPARARPLPRRGLLHDRHLRPHPRARAGRGRPPGARLLRRAARAVRRGLPREPLPRRRTTRRRSASTSATATTRRPTSGPGPRWRSTACATARRATGRGRRRERAQDGGAAGRDPARRARAAAVAHRPRPALRLQRRRGRALRPQGDRDVPRRPGPGLLREPVGAHLSASTGCSSCASRPGSRSAAGAAWCASSPPTPRPRSSPRASPSR